MDTRLLMQQNLQNLTNSQFSHQSTLPLFLHSQSPSHLLAYQTLLLQNRALQLSQLQSLYLQNAQNSLQVKQEPITKTSSPVPSISPNTLLNGKSYNQSLSPQSSATETTPSSLETCPSRIDNQENAGYDAYIKQELKRMINFLLSGMGKKDQEEINKERNRYIKNPCFLQVFDKLVMKYYCAKKCKEDIVRYIIRRVFKLLKASLIKEEKVTGKKATQLLCKRYFQSNFERIEKSGINIENEDELMELFLPYYKKSKNRTMNTTFMVEIFSSEEFCKEYRKFLERFDEILAEDNKKKMDKFLSFLYGCIKKNDLTKLGTFNRLPWLDIWMQDTKNIAIGLMENKSRLNDASKKLKEQ